jgi:hypothetical protein
MENISIVAIIVGSVIVLMLILLFVYYRNVGLEPEYEGYIHTESAFQRRDSDGIPVYGDGKYIPYLHRI